MPNHRQPFQFTGNSAPLGGPLTPPRRPGTVAPNPGMPFGGPNVGNLTDVLPNNGFLYLYRNAEQNFFNLVADVSTLVLAEPDDTRIGFIIRNARNSAAIVGLGFNVNPNDSSLCFAELGPGEAVNATELGWIPQNRIFAFAFGATAKLIVVSGEVKMGG